VQRVIADLEKAGYVRRDKRFSKQGGMLSNEYDLRGLAAALQKLAPDFLKVEEEVKSRRRAVVRKGFNNRPEKTPK